jgi:hypothetical protein
VFNVHHFDREERFDETSHAPRSNEAAPRGLEGALCPLTAAAPIELLARAVIVSVLIGFTGGVWVAHLVRIVQEAADRKNAAEGRRVPIRSTETGNGGRSSTASRSSPRSSW